MPLCSSNCMVFATFLIVNQLFLEPSVYPFNTLQVCDRHMEDVHDEKIIFDTFAAFLT